MSKSSQTTQIEEKDQSIRCLANNKNRAIDFENKNKLNYKSRKQENHEQVAKKIEQKFKILNSKVGRLIRQKGNTIRKFGEYFGVLVIIQKITHSKEAHAFAARTSDTTGNSTIATSTVVVKGKREEIVQAAVEGIQSYLDNGKFPWMTTVTKQEVDNDEDRREDTAVVKVRKPWLNILMKSAIASTLSTSTAAVSTD
jgi:hypothetical protein